MPVESTGTATADAASGNGTPASIVAPTAEAQGQPQGQAAPSNPQASTVEADRVADQGVAKAKAIFNKMAGHANAPEAEAEEAPQPAALRPEQGQPAPAAQRSASQPSPAATAAAQPARDLLGKLRSYAETDRSTGKSKLQGMSDDQVLKAAADEARKALKRWQWDDETIAKTPMDILLDRGMAAISSQSEADRLASDRAALTQLLTESGIDLEQLKNLRKQGGAQAAAPVQQDPARQAPPNAPASAGVQQQAPQAPVVPMPDAIGKAMEAIRASIYHEELAEPLNQIVTALDQGVRSQVGQFQQVIQQQQQAMDQMADFFASQLDRIEMGLARKELTGEFKGLSDPKTWESVQKRAFSLGNLTGYRDANGFVDVNKVVRDAAKFELGDVSKQQRQDALLQRARMEDDGQPDIDTGRAASQLAGGSADDQARAAFDLMRDGHSADEVAEVIRTSRRAG